MAIATTPNDGRRSAPRWLTIATRLLVPAVLLLLLWTLADTDDALARLGAVDWRWIAVAFVFASLQIVLSAARWTLVARRLGLDLPFRDAVSEYYLAQLVNQTVPGGVVGDAARAVRSRHRGDLARAAQAVVIERMTGQVILWAVIVAGLVVSVLVPGGIVWPAPPLAVSIGVAVVVVIGIALGLGMSRGRVTALRSFGRALALALFDRKVRWVQFGLGLVIVAVNLVSFAAAARATGTVMSLEAVMTLVPLILTAMLIPATVAGWGFREGAAAALFPLIPATAAAGLAASLVFGLVILASSLPGVLVLLLRRKTAVTPSD